jgi:hypothetical protein
LPEECHAQLVDLNVRKLQDEDLLWADLVFISSMAIQRDSANTITTRCRELQIKVAAGGPPFLTAGRVSDSVLNTGKLSMR